MSAPDYYLTDTVVINYDGGGEIINRMRICRSKQARWIPTGLRLAGKALKNWIENNEELQTRIVYEEDRWNVRPWEVEFYTAELAERNIKMDTVLSIRRETSFLIQ